MPYADPEKNRACRKRWLERERAKDPNYWRRWKRESDPGKLRHRLRVKYGMTEGQFWELLLKQDGKCAICSIEVGWKEPKKKKAYIDHCHKSGKVRGILCPKCNTAIGFLADCPEMLGKALRYLQND